MKKGAADRSAFKSDLEVLSDSFSFAFDLKERLSVGQREQQVRETERKHNNSISSGGSCFCEDVCQDHLRQAYAMASHLHQEMMAVQLMGQSVTEFLLCLKHKLDPTHVPRDIANHIVNLAKEKRSFVATTISL
jgi:hypothetical protein